MILAAVDSTGYNVMLFLHILSAFVSFAFVIANPLVISQLSRQAPAQASATLTAIHRQGQRVYAPALVLTGVLGFGLSGMSDGAKSLGDTWLVLALLLWIAQNGVLHAVLLPAEKALAGGDSSAGGRVDLAGAALAVSLVIMLWLMVFQPGG